MNVPPPVPIDPADVERWTHSGLRWRLLYGRWGQDLNERLATQIGNVRRSAWGSPDLSSNVFRASVTALAVLYDRPPRLMHEDAAAVVSLTETLRRAGLWALMQRAQRDALGMRECAVRVSVVGGVPSFEIVPPSLLCLRPHPDAPGRPGRYAQAVYRNRPSGPAWTWDVFDVCKADAPVWQVLDANGADISPEVLLDAEGNAAPPGGFHGKAYPWRYADGAPFIPAVLYHAAVTGYLFDPYELHELVDGSLNSAVLWTFFAHCVRDASWPQRWTLNARIPGVEITPETTSADGSTQVTRAAVTTDPSTVLELETTGEDGVAPAQIGQWGPGADPAVLQEAVALYERRVAGYAGISPADIQRVAGDPRSGYALAISKDGQRSAQARFEPVFRLGDEELLSITAAALNRAGVTPSLPERGWRVAYEPISASPEERQSEREHLLALLGQGLIDRVAAYRQLNPGSTDADAAAALSKIAEINARFRA